MQISSSQQEEPEQAVKPVIKSVKCQNPCHFAIFLTLAGGFRMLIPTIAAAGSSPMPKPENCPAG